MDTTQLQNSGLKCSYQAAEGEPVCEGVGHLRRHHEKKSDKGKGKGQWKSAAKGGGKKGKKSEEGFVAKEKRHAMLDFNETHESRVEEYRQRAVKLLEQLKCSRELIDGAGDSEGLEARELDFARGPGGRRPDLGTGACG